MRRSVSCGQTARFWPRNRVLARIGAIFPSIRQTQGLLVKKMPGRRFPFWSERPQAVPERGFVAKNREFCDMKGRKRLQRPAAIVAPPVPLCICPTEARARAGRAVKNGNRANQLFPHFLRGGAHAHASGAPCACVPRLARARIRALSHPPHTHKKAPGDNAGGRKKSRQTVRIGGGGARSAASRGSATAASPSRRALP